MRASSDDPADDAPLDDLDQRITQLTANFAARVHYAVKANSDERVLDVIRARGLGVDVVSLGELQAALRRGFDPARVSFSGVAKDREELTTAEIGRAHVGNPVT